MKAIFAMELVWCSASSTIQHSEIHLQKYVPFMKMDNVKCAFKKVCVIKQE